MMRGRHRFARAVLVAVGIAAPAFAIDALTMNDPDGLGSQNPGLDVTRHAMPPPDITAKPANDAPNGAPQSAGEATPAVSANPLWAIPMSSLAATRNRPLFTPSRRPPAPVVANAPPPLRPPPPPPPPAAGASELDACRYGGGRERRRRGLHRFKAREIRCGCAPAKVIQVGSCNRWITAQRPCRRAIKPKRWRCRGQPKCKRRHRRSSARCRRRRLRRRNLVRLSWASRPRSALPHTAAKAAAPRLCAAAGRLLTPRREGFLNRSSSPILRRRAPPISGAALL